MGISFPGGLSEALGMMGVQFPGTDEGALMAGSALLSGAAGKANGAAGDLSAAVSHVTSSNKGPAASSFAGYMGGQSNVSGAKAFGQALSASSQGHARAAMSVMSLKVVTIAAATAVQMKLHEAKVEPDPVLKALKMMVARAAAGAAGGQIRAMDASLAAAVRAG